MVALGTKMIDPPVVKRAQHTVDLAVATGLMPEEWKPIWTEKLQQAEEEQ